ncbi:RsmB/NOP family class I SAM-dependent RNA methyltransferase [Shewanella cyperi]|nr:RsmB/NOP family class I SAM-dependent RNA methyltransferase [Shewanella cyperi]
MSAQVSPAEVAVKRAGSHSHTIKQLFNDIMESGQSADRVLAAYFKLNRKHGSKDRKLIRETLFALFRWWGWARKLPLEGDALWHGQLALCAALEQHLWEDIRAAWAMEAGWQQLALPGFDTPSATALQLSQLLAPVQFHAADLVPDWFWPLLPPLDDAEREALLTSLCKRPPIWARAQGMARDQAVSDLRALGIEASAAPYFSDALSLGSKSINLNEITLYTAGKLEIQDLSSQVIGQVCDPKPGESWWDACAGAGGKSLQLSSLMANRATSANAGQIVASDIRALALEELGKRARRAGFANISVARWRSDALPVDAGSFDGVLVDAPCSCTGTWRRNPDMRWLDSATAVTDKPELQLDILRRASAAVRKGGVLVYATCSLAEAENRAVAEAFLAAHPEFVPEEFTHPFSGERCTMATVWPQQANSDGMFVARFRRLD